jgi:DNA-binding TFAR19-related protein (PDSD5 family)
MDESEQQKQFEQQRLKLENVVKQNMTKDALSRYANVKIAHPEKSVQALVALVQMLQENQIQTIDDQTLKDVLIKLTPKKGFRIKHGTI